MTFEGPWVARECLHLEVGSLHFGNASPGQTCYKLDVDTFWLPLNLRRTNIEGSEDVGRDQPDSGICKMSPWTYSTLLVIRRVAEARGLDLPSPKSVNNIGRIRFCATFGEIPLRAKFVRFSIHRFV